jgi:hypothetical protein
MPPSPPLIAAPDRSKVRVWTIGLLHSDNDGTVVSTPTMLKEYHIYDGLLYSCHGSPLLESSIASRHS